MQTWKKLIAHHLKSPWEYKLIQGHQSSSKWLPGLQCLGLWWGLNLLVRCPLCSDCSWLWLCIWDIRISWFEILLLHVDDEKSSSAFDATSVIEVDVDDELQSHCKKVGICVVGMLDRSSASFSADLNMLQNLAIKRSSDPLGFFWVDSADRTLFLDGLSVLKSDLPTLVAVSEHKMRYAVLREDMSLSNADHFLNGIMSGRERTAILQVGPALYAFAIMYEYDAEPRILKCRHFHQWAKLRTWNLEKLMRSQEK